MFEFLLSIRGSFLAVRVGRMPRRCAATTADEKQDKFRYQAAVGLVNGDVTPLRLS